MISKSETGHAKNVANFAQLIAFCEGYGVSYNPSRKEFALASLQNTLTQAQTVLTDLHNAKTSFDNATNQRREAFANLPKFSVQVVNALAATGVSSLALNDAKGVLERSRVDEQQQQKVPKHPLQRYLRRLKTNKYLYLNSVSTTLSIISLN